MTRGASRTSIIAAIVKKDFKEYTRDTFFVAMTIAGLIIYVAMFWLLPSSVEESIEIGVHSPGMEEAFAEIPEDEGLDFIPFKTAGGLKKAVGLDGGGTKKNLKIGIDFPDDFASRVAEGRRAEVTIYLDSSVPKAISRAVSSWVREMAFAITGNALPVTLLDEDTVILGEDRVGNQVPLREKMRPMFAFFILMMEVLALGTLVAGEVKERTVTAVLVTPARVSDFLLAKGIIGTAVAFTEVTLLMLLIRALSNNPIIMLLALLLGAVLVTGFGLIAGASGKDFINMIFFSLLFLIPLLIPAFAVFFPGSSSVWVKALPSYGLVQTIVGISAYDQSFREVLPHLGSLAAWCVLVFVAGWVMLKRKVESI